MNTITLNNGVKMPQMGYGVYQVSPAECERSWGPFAEGLNDFFHNELLTEIGKAHGKTFAQTALRFLIQRGVIIIPQEYSQGAYAREPRHLRLRIDIRRDGSHRRSRLEAQPLLLSL